MNSMIPLEVPVIFQDCFSYCCCCFILFFYTKLKIVFSRSIKNCFGILMGISLKLWIAFGRIGIYTVLILQMHKHGRYFYLLISSSVFSYSLHLLYWDPSCFCFMSPSFAWSELPDILYYLWLLYLISKSFFIYV